MAYGARLESELGESPQGFNSPILRAKKHPRLSGVFLCTGSRDLGADCVIAGDHLQSDWLFEICLIALASDGSPILRHKKRTSFWVFFSDFNELSIAGEHLANKVISARALDSFQNKVIKNRKVWSDQDSQKMACRVHRNCDFSLCRCGFRNHGNESF